MDGLTVVTEGFLREALRITALPRPLRPSVTIRVQADSVNAQPFATLLELRGPIAGPDGSEVGEERAAGRQRAEDFLHFIPEAQQRYRFRFLARETDDPLRPVHTSW